MLHFICFPGISKLCDAATDIVEWLNCKKGRKKKKGYYQVKQELSFITGRNAKQYIHFGKQFVFYKGKCCIVHLKILDLCTAEAWLEGF